MDTIELETIKLRLEGIRQAITRSRFTFLVSTIASVAIFVTAWNAYLSWDNEFAMQTHWSADKLFTGDERTERLKVIARELKIDPNSLKEIGIKPEDISQKIDSKELTQVTDYAQQQLVSEWVKNHIITVGLLGIRVSVNDLPVLGSMSLFIISIWFYYSVRRENRAIGTLFRDSCRLKDWQVRYMVYQGIVHHLVLIDFASGHRPIYDYTEEESENIKDRPFISSALRILFYLPVISILFVISMDMLTLLYFAAPFRPSHKPLWHILDMWDWIKVGAMESVALMFMVSTGFLCRRIREFIDATETLLKSYREDIKNDVGEQCVSG